MSPPAMHSAPYTDIPLLDNHKRSQDTNACDCSAAHHRQPHRRRLLVLLPAVLSLLALAALLAFACMAESGISGLDNLLPRDSTPSDIFVKNKLYIVVAVVGLLVVIIMGVMLSAWCCKESFSNPLCCPCYLCACCGGLACLECIGCGLCAGLDQV